MPVNSTDDLTLSEVLAAIDTNAKELWSQLTAQQQKKINLWLLNRYASSVTGSREKQELSVIKTNEYFNKNYNAIESEKELQWKVLCSCAISDNIENHRWIKPPSFKTKNKKAIEFLSDIYSDCNSDELEIILKKNSTKQIKDLAKEYGIEKIKL